MILNEDKKSEHESILILQIKIENKNFNFITCYKAPDYDNDTFIDELENQLFYNS